MIQFIKVRDVKSPVRNPLENAGIDFYVPENTQDFKIALKAKNSDLIFANASTSVTYFDDNGTIHLAPRKDILIPSGIKGKFSPMIALIANNKSGIATKKKLIIGGSVIDASYQGEWHLHLINTSDSYQTIECGQKIIQFIPHLISIDEIEVLDKTAEEFFTKKTDRGEGGFGSTGVK